MMIEIKSLSAVNINVEWNTNVLPFNKRVFKLYVKSINDGYQNHARENFRP